ncbi:tRNA (adenosine(37)-N6)-threonylcarbamoyltransferase complex dimerization subunit type 1 TsaB [Adhaeribacter aquaticus]|uniref:tRNA (adenosine(37)-N6)-threonylcarbamoyltransferase complex dimerization subunit type 1 TsaB n=1 Tax=Adhaeribacter aquaticus TaxID=299567 RepID=UPI00040FF7BC|nr:tRNA (adenosine(37)-N6)-threonylcarbamoyltransferase complex dimerization subunit type 1 TsaB [Adhaeribacter aquaticus]
MAFLLALETSSTICSVALFKNEQLLGLSELQIEKSHSSYITKLIEQLLQNCQVEIKDLSAIAISGGPGSYTGLRIGSSTAKGLCFSLDIPLIQVSTLQAMATEAIAFTPKAEEYYFCPMIDARRLEVYTCLVNAALEEKVAVAPVILEEGLFQDYSQEKKIIFLGSGSEKYKDLVTNKEQMLFLDNIKPTAQSIGRLGWLKFLQKDFEDVAYYEPFYLKEVYITTKKN